MTWIDYLAQEATRTTRWEQAQEEESIIQWSGFQIELAWRKRCRSPKVEIFPSSLLVEEEERKRSHFEGSCLVFSSPMPHSSRKFFAWTSEEDAKPKDELWFTPGPSSHCRTGVVNDIPKTSPLNFCQSS